MGRERSVGRCQREIGAAHFQPAVAQPLEGLRGRDFVGQMQVDEEQGGRVRLLVDDMGIPKLLDDGARHKSPV